ASLKVVWPVFGGGYTLTSITADRFMSRFFHGPLGSGYYTSGYLNNWYNGTQASEELRLSSPATTKLTWVAGLYYNDRDVKNKGLQPSLGYGQAYDEYPNTPYGQNVEISSVGGMTHTHAININEAAYVDGALHLTDKLQINMGARATHDVVFTSIYNV